MKSLGEAARIFRDSDPGGIGWAHMKNPDASFAEFK
jgi:hypothetical protein